MAEDAFYIDPIHHRREAKHGLIGALVCVCAIIPVMIEMPILSSLYGGQRLGIVSGGLATFCIFWAVLSWQKSQHNILLYRLDQRGITNEYGNTRAWTDCTGVRRSRGGVYLLNEGGVGFLCNKDLSSSQWTQMKVALQKHLPEHISKQL